MTVKEEVLPPPEIVVAGRHFTASVETTFEQDMFIMATVQQAGLNKLGQDFDFRSGEMTEIASQIIAKAFSSGKLFALLGAVLTESDQEWTQELARERELFFRKIKKPEDKKALHAAIITVILGFFVSGLLSSQTSQVSLTPLQEDAVSPSNSEETAAPEILDSGDQLSGNSLDSIQGGTTL